MPSIEPLQPNADNPATMFGFKKKTYPTRQSLEPVRSAISDAFDLFDENFQKSWSIGLAPSAVGIAGGVAGAAVGKGTLVIGAVSGTHGAAALASGLAFAGTVIGGGMAAGIAVVAAPVAIVGGGAYLWARTKQQSRLDQEKQALLEVATTKLAAIGKHSWPKTLEDHVRRVEARLEDAISYLKNDLA
jgi:hypothetical protein